MYAAILVAFVIIGIVISLTLSIKHGVEKPFDATVGSSANPTVGSSANPTVGSSANTTVDPVSVGLWQAVLTFYSYLAIDIYFIWR